MNWWNKLMSIDYEFFPIYEEQMESEEFQKLSPIKKCYYWLIQSMANKTGEFYFSDTNFAAALGCSFETITKYRRVFVNKGWIEIVPGKKDKQGRMLATVYTSVKWSKTPKQGEGLRFCPFQRYALEMLLNNKVSIPTVTVYVILNYWRFFHESDDVDFFITKSQLKKLSGIQSSKKVESCIEELYKSFIFEKGRHLFKYEDDYHRYKFSMWSVPADPTNDINNRDIQKNFWEYVFSKGKELQKSKQATLQEKQLIHSKKVLEYFIKKYKSSYGNIPSPFEVQVKQLAELTNKFGAQHLHMEIDKFFAAEKIAGIAPSSRKTLRIFIEVFLEV
jgi:hypothetical protein